jgi:small subunit ribosomal protein S16
MLRIRLKRVGRRNDPSYRVVVTEMSRGPKSGDAVEQVGFYNPKTKERTFDGERITYWMTQGAQPSDTVYNMLVDAKIVEGKKKNVLPRKTPLVKEKEEETTAEETATAKTSSGEGETASENEASPVSAEEGAPKEEKAPESAPAEGETAPVAEAALPAEEIPAPADSEQEK